MGGAAVLVVVRPARLGSDLADMMCDVVAARVCGAFMSKDSVLPMEDVSLPFSLIMFFSNSNFCCLAANTVAAFSFSLRFSRS